MSTKQVTAPILIRTLPLDNGNYGGLLQAFALQQVFNDLGLEAVTDRSPRRLPRSRRAKRALRIALLSLGYERPGWLSRAVGDPNGPRVSQFADRHIRTAPLYVEGGKLNQALIDTSSAFVVGSDQVWRKRYADPEDYLFNFLGANDTRPRLSYAASFGTDNLDEYGPERIARTKLLAHRLSGVSVREESGVALAGDAWGVTAEHHVDPTLLVPRSTYLTLARGAVDAFPAGKLVDYVLDDGPASRSVVSSVASTLAVEPLSLIPRLPDSYQEFRRNPDRFARPSVEAWLGAIGSARMVVTDSFHGTVFAILHNVPFVSVVNQERGAARFESLLKLFGLEERLIAPGQTVPEHLSRKDVDWARVNERIIAERERSVEYLRRQLCF